MSQAAVADIAPRKSIANGVLSGAGLFWFAVVLIGQWLFFYYIAAFYGASVVNGDFEIWNRLKALGREPFVAGDTGGNLAYVTHALAAGYIALGGVLQLVPWIRAKAPVFHHWNGRLYLLTVTGLSLSGFYLVWIRQTSPSLTDGISTTFNGVLILTFAFFALRTAMARNIEIHQRWAMRLFLVSNAQWFLRVGLFAFFVVSKAAGAEVSMSHPFLKFWTFGCYLVPIAVLELYLRAKRGRSGFAKVTVASGLVVLTLLMGAGIFAFSMFSQMIITGAPLRLG